MPRVFGPFLFLCHPRSAPAFVDLDTKLLIKSFFSHAIMTFKVMSSCNPKPEAHKGPFTGEGHKGLYEWLNFILVLKKV